MYTSISKAFTYFTQTHSFNISINFLYFSKLLFFVSHSRLFVQKGFLTIKHRDIRKNKLLKWSLYNLICSANYQINALPYMSVLWCQLPVFIFYLHYNIKDSNILYILAIDMILFIDTPEFVLQAVEIIHFSLQVYTGEQFAQYAGWYDDLDFLYKS